MYSCLNLLRRTPRVALLSRARLNDVGHGNRDYHVAMVGGGLVCSAPKVYKWFSAAFGSRFEAAGAVICLEAVMTFSPVVSLSAAALAVLVFVNAIYCACRLQVHS